MKRLLASAAVVTLGLGLTACVGVSDEDRNEVQSAIVGELIDEGTAARFLDGDDAAAEFVEGMHELAEDMAASIIDEDMCGSLAYESALGSARLLTAHRAGCAAAERLGLG